MASIYRVSRICRFDVFGTAVFPTLWALMLHFPRGQLLLRYYLLIEFKLAGKMSRRVAGNIHLCVVLRLRHMHRHVSQGLEALPTPHALQDLPRL